MKAYIICFVLGAIIGAVILWECQRIFCHDETERVDDIICDTTYIIDTLIIEKPVVRTARIIDTIHVNVSDTVWITSDSTVNILIESKTYADCTYRAVVSGYHPSLDSIVVYPRTSIVTLYYDGGESRKSRWGLGVQAGYGGTGDGLSPYIGVGISYNILTW